MPRKKVLFLIGSPNQTTQMHQIAELLRDEFDPYFSQVYYDGWMRKFYQFLLWTRGLDPTAVAGVSKQRGDAYLQKHGLANDFENRVFGHDYDLVVCCSDIIVPWNLLARTKSVFVQEGMTDARHLWQRLVHRFTRFPILAIGTALNGMNNCCDIYCVASAGYAEHFREMGVSADKLVVTGIPNFDHAARLRANTFPHRGYVMVATTDMRETYRFDNRRKFFAEATRIAAGRPLLVKFHPNEKMARALAEARRYCPPGTLFFTEGNTDEMIANSVELITQYSTVAFVGLALGIPTHSYFDMADLTRKQPWQNGGSSAVRIAAICRGFAGFAGSGAAFLRERGTGTGPFAPAANGPAADPEGRATVPHSASAN